MADTKISGLPAASALTGTDEFGVNQGATSKKATAAQVKTYVLASDTWHVVGTAGEPTFASGWGAQDADGVRFRKAADGMVDVFGRASRTTGSGTLFTLPAGYRPSFEIRNVAQSGSANTPYNLSIQTDGQVVLNSVGSLSWAAIAVSFPTA